MRHRSLIRRRNAYVIGSTESSTDFPLQSAEQSTYGGGSFRRVRVAVIKLNSGGTALCVFDLPRRQCR